MNLEQRRVDIYRAFAICRAPCSGNYFYREIGYGIFFLVISGHILLQVDFHFAQRLFRVCQDFAKSFQIPKKDRGSCYCLWGRIEENQIRHLPFAIDLMKFEGSEAQS